MIKAFLDGFPKKTLAGGMSSRPGEHPVAVTQGYGLTEATPFSHVMNLAEGVAHVGQVGKIMPTMQARLVDIESGIDVGEGEPGELWLRGPSVMRGYWKDDEATKSAFAEGGWFKTGDVAVADEHEYFT